ncbi:sialidase family protein [Lysinibacillus sp. NPDC092081]|uniref:sialidase family protein n=1 Tax=Lysinibacillus sp. NPDC092081 TaxID=3364131 RepID=UPI0038252324
MALFYYDKFTAIQNTYPVVNEYTQKWSSESYSGQNYMGSGYSSYTFDKTTGKFAVSGSYITIQGSFNAGTIYSVSGNTLYRAVASLSVTMLAESTCTAELTQTGGGGTYYTKGSLVQSDIIAEDGAYPANGRHSDGSWYVKKTAVGALPPGTVTTETSARIRPNNGRKLVILDNGWWVAATYVTDYFARIWVSKDEGENWEQTIYVSSTIKNVTIAAVGNDIAILYTTASTAMYSLWNPISKTWTVLNKQINGNAMQVDTAPSMVYDKATNKVHITMSVKNPGASYNIAYVYSSDKGNSFSATKMLTGANSSGLGSYSPDMVVLNNKVYLVFREVSGGTTVLQFMYSADGGANFNNTFRTVYNSGDKSVDMPIIRVDDKGRINIAFHCSTTANATSHLDTRYSDDLGTNWKVPSTPINLYNNASFADMTIDKNGTMIVLGQTAKGIIMFVSKDRGDIWTSISSEIALGAYAHVLYDPERRFKFGESIEYPPPFILETTSGIQFKGKIITNNNPTIAIASPTDNQTLYENDVMNISGDMYDPDKDQSVTAYYQINSESRKVLATNLSQTQIPLSKQLMFKGGKLYDGDTAITGALAEGVAHKLKVWAVDSENATSTVVERSFYVVPNRAPLLSVDTVVPSGIIDLDKFKVSGKAWDEDANSSVKVTRRINANDPVEIYSGTGGDWEFEVSLAQLVVGENTIVVEVIDNYGAKASKTIKLNKNAVKTPVLQSVARYKIEPPKGSARGVLLWVQRDEELDLKVELSMTLKGEQEQYSLLEVDPKNILPVAVGIVEDEYYHETLEPKDNIILKLTTTRANVNIDHKIYLIMGVVE